ncbi:extracellular serine-rich protein [Cordyceps fumosorosea ARSEF 2679]|uniref:Extracellular serine-rich protein n=1 Tax=Cordyceps fumosorosea (strain ARSEF 2679) TaxID=1081104 RepID=A0A167RLE7_CORFA|nr:extracellular serine-rich protein [Cordyceps fumosorosea ARSEF 2679]OAA58709.1 extracellular serine-rich protein [Cordyceps fumosorosea ARSEF 2679]
MRSNIALLAATAAAAQAKMIRVDVGMDGLTFSPDVITAAKGDMLSFHFYPQRHSVVLGTKDKPCEPATEELFYSGFMPTTEGEAASTFMVTVNSTDPMYLYCSSAKHCQGGMVAIVNGDKDALDTYKTAAAKATDNVSPNSVTGGTIMSNNGAGMSTGGTKTSAGGTGASASSTSKPGAAAGFKASMAGVLVAAGGVAAMML